MKRFSEIEGELWRPIPGFAQYQVSDLGRVRRQLMSGWREIEGKVDRTGYRQIGLIRDGRQHWFMMHRVVACTFLPGSDLAAQPDTFLTVNHRDRDKLNNRLSNLEIVSMQDNHRHWRRYPLAAMATSLR